jgi:uncharacterized protein (TIGR00369 family)
MIPDGFQPHFRKSPVTDPWEPLYSRRSANKVELAFEVRTAHCNSRGFLHGGVLAALCDNFMGLSLAAILNNAQASIVTVNLAIDYIGSAKIGDVVIIEPRVIKSGGVIAFCDALARSGDTIIARANGTFRVKIAA